MDDQWGVPEREMEVTDQPRWAAARQMRLPVHIHQSYSIVCKFIACIEARTSFLSFVLDSTYLRIHCRRILRASSLLLKPFLGGVVVQLRF
jgi:hypothetical protein